MPGAYHTRRRTFVRQGGIRRRLDGPRLRRCPQRLSRWITRRKAFRHKQEQNRRCGQRRAGVNNS